MVEDREADTSLVRRCMEKMPTVASQPHHLLTDFTLTEERRAAVVISRDL
jgi:hypothetical protein